MKFQVAAIAAFAGAAVAQDACLTQAAAIPACALGYLVSAASQVAQCGLVDFACQCSNSGQIQGMVINTVLSACGSSAQSVLGSVGDLCSCVTANAGQSVSLNSVQSACAASAEAIPPCALGYLADAGASIGNCAVDDFACQCSNSASIQNAIASTLNDQCSAVGLQAVISSANALCSCVTANGGGSGSGSGSGSSAAATTPAGSSGAATTAATSPKATGGSAPSASAAPSVSKFTGAAATAIPAVGGIFGAVIGLLAYL